MLEFSVAGAAVAFMTLASSPASALEAVLPPRFTETFDATVINGPDEFLDTQGFGSFSYFIESVPATGAFTLTPALGLKLDLAIFGQVFIETDDLDHPAFPAAHFFDGVFDSLDYVVLDQGDLIARDGVFSISFEAFGGIDIDARSQFAAGPGVQAALPDYSLGLAINAVAPPPPLIAPAPLPAALPMFAAALALGGIVARRRANVG